MSKHSFRITVLQNWIAGLKPKTKKKKAVPAEQWNPKVKPFNLK